MITVVVTFTDSRGNMEMATSAAVTYVNTPATGMPTITGTAQVGETLMANTSAIMDADGLPATFTYQWMSNGTPIPVAMAATYDGASDRCGHRHHGPGDLHR